LRGPRRGGEGEGKNEEEWKGKKAKREGRKCDDGAKAGKWGGKGGLAPPSQNLDPPL